MAALVAVPMAELDGGANTSAVGKAGARGEGGDGGDRDTLSLREGNSEEMRVGCVDPSRSRPLGPTRGTRVRIFRASSALSRSEARFELLPRTRLRALFESRWTVLSSTEPT
jgi:hypothetical protein